MAVIGFNKQLDIEFNEKISLVTCMDTVRTIFSSVAQNKWLVYQIDVKSVFLNEYLKEEVYVGQPQGYEVSRQEHKVYMMKKELYCLK